MKDYPVYRAARTDVDALLETQRLGRLVAVDVEGWPQIGLHPFTWDGTLLEVHLVNTDEHLTPLSDGARVVFEVDEVLSSAKSHWIDREDAKHADHFYRCVILRGTVALSRDPGLLESHLTRLMKRYQPEGHYAPIQSANPLYRASLAALTLVRLHVQQVLTKFKLGQKISEADRSTIAEELRRRGSEIDIRTATAIGGRGEIVGQPVDNT